MTDTGRRHHDPAVPTPAAAARRAHAMRRTEYDPILHATMFHTSTTPLSRLLPPRLRTASRSTRWRCRPAPWRRQRPRSGWQRWRRPAALSRKGPSCWTGRPWRRSSLRRSVRSAVTPERGDAVGPTWVRERRHPRSRPLCSPRQALSSRLQAASLPAGVAAAATAQRGLPCSRVPLRALARRHAERVR